MARRNDNAVELVGFYRPAHRRRVSVTFPAETMTEQSHKKLCDINNIMARYTKSGVLDHVRRFEPVYSDVTEGDYLEAMNRVAAAKTMFEELPSTIRRHFGDDVATFLAFCDQSTDAPGELQAIAEEYRQRSLDNPPAPPSEQPAEPETATEPEPPSLAE